MGLEQWLAQSGAPTPVVRRSDRRRISGTPIAADAVSAPVRASTGGTDVSGISAGGEPAVQTFFEKK